MYSLAMINLYAGKWDIAHQRLQVDEKKLRQSLILMQIQSVRIQTLEILGRVKLAMAAGSEAFAPRLLKEVEKIANQLASENMAWADALALLLRAGILSVRQQNQKALNVLAKAASDLAALDMQLFAAAAKWRQGELLRNEQGRKMMQAATLVMEKQNLQNPARWVTMLAPGFIP